MTRLAFLTALGFASGAALLVGNSASAATCNQSFGGQTNLCSSVQTIAWTAGIAVSETNNDGQLELERAVVSVSAFDPPLGTLVGANVMIDGTYDVTFERTNADLPQVVFDFKPTSGSGVFTEIIAFDATDDNVSGQLIASENYLGADAVAAFETLGDPSILIDFLALSISGDSGSEGTLTAEGSDQGDV